MNDRALVAVPSENSNGLSAPVSSHFGHCNCYTVAEITSGTIGEVHVAANPGHTHGGCIEPVKELAKQGVKVLLAGGMGLKPLTALKEMGITVYHCANVSTVEEALNLFIAGKLNEFGNEQLCTGCHGNH